MFTKFLGKKYNIFSLFVLFARINAEIILIFQTSPFKSGPPSRGISTPGIASVSKNISHTLLRKRPENETSPLRKTSPVGILLL